MTKDQIIQEYCEEKQIGIELELEKISDGDQWGMSGRMRYVSPWTKSHKSTIESNELPS